MDGEREEPDSLPYKQQPLWSNLEEERECGDVEATQGGIYKQGECE